MCKIFITSLLTLFTIVVNAEPQMQCAYALQPFERGSFERYAKHMEYCTYSKMNPEASVINESGKTLACYTGEHYGRERSDYPSHLWVKLIDPADCKVVYEYFYAI